MGLDMYIYRMEKITEREVADLIGQHTDNIPEKYTFFTKDDFDENADMYSDLIPLITQIEMVKTLFDYKRCFAEHKIDENSICGSHFSSDSVGWMLSDGRHVKLTRAEYESYFYDANVDMYVLKGKMVAYWRKSHDLHDFLEESRIQSRTMDFIAENQRVPTDEDVALWTTENCGYYELSLRERQRLNDWIKNHPDDSQDEEFMQLLHDENVRLFYEAWW